MKARSALARVAVPCSRQLGGEGRPHVKLGISPVSAMSWYLACQGYAPATNERSATLPTSCLRSADMRLSVYESRASRALLALVGLGVEEPAIGRIELVCNCGMHGLPWGGRHAYSLPS
jgi:hypothetical protein